MAAVQHALTLLPERIHDPLPDKLREKYHLCTLRYALETIHFPKIKRKSLPPGSG